MKFLLVISFFTSIPLASAETFNFKCKSTPTPSINEFNAEGIISIDPSSHVSGVNNVTSEKVDEVESSQVFEEIKVTGIKKHFRAGEVNNMAFDELVLSSDNAYLKTFNLIFDEEGALSSDILSVDNFLYRSICLRLK